MKKENAKAEIRIILKDSVTKGTYYYYSVTRPMIVFGAIRDTLKENKLQKRLSYYKFENLFNKFIKNYKKDFTKASNTFLSFLDEKSAPSTVSYLDNSNIPTIKKLKGKKRTRKKDLLYYEDLFKSYQEIKQFIPLVVLKSYNLEKNKSEDEKQSLYYIFDYYGINIYDAEEDWIKGNLGYFVKLNKAIIHVINILKHDLDFSTRILFNDNKVSEAKMWFVDKFGEASERYLPDWQKHQRHSHNPPDFKKSYKIFIKFIKGSKPKELGFTKSSYNRLRYEIVPRGVIELLYQIHIILYLTIDRERGFLKEKKEQIEKILENIPRHQACEIFNDILSQSAPQKKGIDLPQNALKIHRLLKSSI